MTHIGADKFTGALTDNAIFCSNLSKSSAAEKIKMDSGIYSMIYR